MKTNIYNVPGQDEHDVSKFGMWLFIFAELLLFGALFIIYTAYRSRNPAAFKLAGNELELTVGIISTIILLISSTTMAISVTAIQKNNKKLSLLTLGITILFAIAFLLYKYFEWGTRINEGFLPDTSTLHELGPGTILFFGLYFVMTGLHALHILIGLIFIIYIFFRIIKNRINSENYHLFENFGLFWHLVVLIWIFLFPLFYLIR